MNVSQFQTVMDQSIEEVWTMLDRKRLIEIARSGPAPVFATISGAHLYGFASPDSDVDLRGAVLLPARALLGLHPPKETIQGARYRQGRRAASRHDPHRKRPRPATQVLKSRAAYLLAWRASLRS